ncbi:iporin-like isoform X2 [Coregonus clupeaformis]|uniref:iporin-like isoform X2 n=1 Tax=Coregonus clupeaformis TaxID=59861 RepID=UPI001E1C650F|nr:iporin-like isoform X2 [Coregonus clupeaformis]
MAFSPDGENMPLPPPLEVRKSNEETLKKSTSGSTSSSGSTSGSGSKVMTKELRNRSKHSSPAYQLITEPDPDPTVITPDPDFLYNLKWRREKTDSDGIQWEYTSQAQAAFLQPPPLTSLAAFREMFQKAEDAIGQPELCPSQQIGFSASEGNLWRMDGQRKEEGEKRKEEVEEEEVEVRGTADGGRTWESRTTAVRSVSFAGSVQRGGTSLMGDDVKAPLRGMSSLCLLEKRALVSAVSVAVEAILAQFSSSRTLVQKALSGDSSVNPSLGRLVLQCLCPALRSLLSDGLKPHQSDLISGRRPNSAWGLVQASTRPGPSTQSLHSLQARIGELPQLRQNKHRFNAFLLGLLNIKLLDFWLSHLQSCSDVLVTFYRPSSFMRLSLTSCQPLFEELLLLLQPLSLLTLNLDLLFQHHHLEPANHSPEILSPPNQDLGFRLSPRGSASQGRGSSYLESLSELDFGSVEPEVTNRNASSSSLANSGVGGLVESLKPASLSVGPAKVSGGLAETSPQLMWVQEKEIRELAPPNVEEASLSQQAGQVIQQGWGAVVRWGGKLGQNLAELSLSAVQNQNGTSRDPPEPQASTQARSDPPQVDGALAVPWGLGRLFGASNNPTKPTLSTRRPSQWLSPGESVLTRMVSSSSSANQRRALEPQQVEEVVEREKEETWDNPRPLRSVRTLCDHSGTGAELSFQKGEELLVLGGVDHDWIRCRQGDREGLVPIGYASLIM